PKAGGKEKDVAFEVSFAVDGGSPTVLQTTDQKGLIVTGITPGSTYTFTVVAIADEVISSPASTTLEIEAVEVEEPEEEETPPEGKGKGNGNGNGNGEGTTPPEEEPAPPVVEPVEPPVEEPVPPEEEPVPPEEGTDEATNTTTNEARAASINKVISDVTGD
ncbi:MAG TPA: penicillin-binding protein, partial [Paenisporosarcina sp.]|nr:penicillin-binding protein [Paenisporosarcina sp.]